MLFEFLCVCCPNSVTVDLKNNAVLKDYYSPSIGKEYTGSKALHGICMKERARRPSPFLERDRPRTIAFSSVVDSEIGRLPDYATPWICAGISRPVWY